MDVYIHAGTFKTASTAVQQALYSCRSHLLEQKILFPVSGISSLAEVIGYRHSRFVYEFGLRSWDAEVDKLIAEIHQHKPDLLVLSSEAWSKPKGTKRLIALLNKLEQFQINRVDVTFVVRNGFDYSISFYREFVRRWGQRRTYLAYTNKRIPYYDYNQLFAPFLAIPGINVKFIQYSRDCVTQVLNDIGLDNPESSQNQEVNAGLSALDTELQRRINILTKSKGHPAPLANELFETIGLKQEQDKVIENSPPPALIELYDDAYKQAFSELTGLSRKLLEINNSIYFSQDYVKMDLFTPLLDYLLPQHAK